MLAQRQISPVVALPLLINIVANVAFTSLQFSFAATSGVARCSRRFRDDYLELYHNVPAREVAAWLQIPYLLSVSSATALQFSTIWLNH
jgi:tryptophan-rich sensory protein